MVFEYLATDRIKFDVPLDALGIAQFDLIDIFAIFLFQLGIGHGRVRVFGQRRGIEFFERLNSTCIAQFQRLIRAQILGLNVTGSDSEGSGSKKAVKVFMSESPL